MKKFSKKSVGLAVVGTLIVAATAFAYLLATGSGGGTGSVATDDTRALVLTADVPTLTKIGDTQKITIYATNSGKNPIKAGTISGSVAPSAAALTAGCASNSFTLGDFTSSKPQVTPNNTAQAIGSVDVTFNNRDSDQAGCLGTDTVKLTLSSAVN